ncbi:alpha/beta fold hydrolase [Microbacterium algeriense]|uniref:Alpha/beta hydrolase n=1 Tax=Microbacterium algeriense TaxID=2615184 RepID=A0ABQ6V3I5_9MICO|nr:alpha/beta hydrolase [Microbacterium algeriense]KAB1862494.1 alpha/beta hydrolase [Microbacterium algeriense]
MTVEEPLFPGFAEARIPTGDAEIFVRYGGSGPAVMLLHGHPRTSATWHRVAPLLVEQGFTVICPDLRGYGRSRGPRPVADHSAHSKRAVAADMVEVARRLGQERFHLAGHDRGSYVALRLALDHPDRVDRLALMDCIPITEHLRRADARFATSWWHWFFFAQPVIPERVINADPDAWYAAKADAETMGAANHAELRAAVHDPEVVRAMLEDYRAGLTVDREHEEADRSAGRRIDAPTLILWSAHDDLESLHGDPLEIWRSWATDVRGHRVDSRHHMAEEAAPDVAASLGRFFS